ncbi:hypothetical protein BN14_00326 [Rhizoctonia solani AG-1 IB]|uniref:Nucleoside diphosphate kinase n=1 Tax=Thanatephorus cucumeris (strain AG1-IB / isolate 7/3/14) TaxID=1108050 RepID=M5BII8_THACB|nr:hypothetical protein BN14_00326 [Rhizoctonia solani AG-1 IB]
MPSIPEREALSTPSAFDRDGLRLSVGPEARETPPRTPPPQMQDQLLTPGGPRSTLAVLIIKPHATKQRLKIEKRILEAGFEILKERKMGFHLDGSGVVELFGADAPSLCGEPVWVYVLSRPRSASVLSALVGPLDPLAARRSDPECLRALYGANRWENGVWTTKDESGAERIVSELFAGSPIMELSDLPSVHSSPGHRRVRKVPSHTSSIRSHLSSENRTRASPNSRGGSVPPPASVTKSPAGLKARPAPTATSPSIVPRTTRASDLRAGNNAPPPPRQRQSQEERERTFEGVPGHKRRESFSVASTAAPVITPRQNRSAILRAQKQSEGDKADLTKFPSMSDSQDRRTMSPEELEEKNRTMFEGVPGHKRRESIKVASTAAPTVAPRPNRSSLLRAQKMAAAAAGNPGPGGAPPSSFKGAATESGPARSLNTRSSVGSIGASTSKADRRASIAITRPAPATVSTAASKRLSLALPSQPSSNSNTGGALTPISNGRDLLAQPRPKMSPKKPDIEPRTNKSALLRAAAKLKSAAGATVGKSTSRIEPGGSGLPSPPATNSTASTGKESLPKRVRKTSIAFATVKSMLTGERVRKPRHDDDDELIEDEDHTTRFSGPTTSNSSDGNSSVALDRSTSIGARSTTSSGGMERAKSLADRNRMVLDKLSSISSAASSRISSPAPNDRVPLTASTLRSRAVSPMPPTNNTLFPPKSNASATSSSPRGSYSSLTSPNVRSSRDLEPDTPVYSSRVHSSDRQIRDSEESTTPKERERLYASQRAPPSSYTASRDSSTSGSRREGSVRVSFSRNRPEMDVDEFGMNRPSQAQSLSQSQSSRQRAYSSESDDRSITPPADASRRLAIEQISGGRGRRISITEPDASPTKPREPLRTRAAAGTLGRQRNSAEVIERTVAAARKSPVRTRAALPSEFRSNTEGKRASWDGKRFSLDGKRTLSRITNSPENLRRDSGNRTSPVVGSRAATVRESSRRTHSRWASEDVLGDGNDNGNGRPRYERRGGSIESPIIPGGRSVVGESLKAAGIITRRDTNESNSRVTDSRYSRDSRDSTDWDVEQLRNGIARVGVGDSRIREEPDDDESEEESTTPGKRGNGRPVQTIVTSRPSTSSGNHLEEGPRTAPPALRQYRSNTGLITPSGSGTVRERSVTPVTPAMLVSAASTEHLRLMLESFAMFESTLARLEASNPGGGVTELLQNADVVVQATQSLNNMLRESAARALTEQIDSEVEDRESREVEIWRATGMEFRDAVKS